jgi:putative redox protein
MNSPDLQAAVHYAGEDLYVAISPSGHAITLETDGKRNSAPAPMELLLMKLGACAGSDVVSIMRKNREKITSYRVEARGRRREAEPRGFSNIEVRHIVRGHNVSAKALVQAIELSETKYCSVTATLRPAAEIKSSYEIIEEVTAAEAAS